MDDKRVNMMIKDIAFFDIPTLKDCVNNYIKKFPYVNMSAELKTIFKLKDPVAEVLSYNDDNTITIRYRYEKRINLAFMKLRILGKGKTVNGVINLREITGIELVK